MDGLIEVPGHLQTQGYDKPQYTNTIYPWDGKAFLRPPQVDMEHNIVGSYVKDFTVSEPLRGKRTILSFQGFETAIYVRSMVPLSAMARMAIPRQNLT